MGLFDKLKKMANSIIIAGIMLFLYGLYYLLTKGGVLLPFHDAPEAILEHYYVGVAVARIIMKLGIATIVVGMIFQLIKVAFMRHQNQSCKEFRWLDILIMFLFGISIAAFLLVLRGAYFFMFREIDEMAQTGMYAIGYTYPSALWKSIIANGMIASAVSAITASIFTIKNKKTSNILRKNRKDKD